MLLPSESVALPNMTNDSASYEPHFDDDSLRHVVELHSSNSPLSLIVIVVADVHRVANLQGGMNSEQVLCDLQHVIRDNLRSDDILVSVGQKGFAILLLNSQAPGAVRTAVAVWEAMVLQRRIWSRHSISATVNIGLAEWLPGGDARELLVRVKQALHAAHEMGGNRICGPEGVLSLPQQIDETDSISDWLTKREPSLSVMVDLENEASNRQAFATECPADIATLSVDGAKRHLSADGCDYTHLGEHIRCQILDSRDRGRTFSLILVHLDEDAFVRYGDALLAPWVLSFVVAHTVRANVRPVDQLAPYDDTTLGLILPGVSLQNAVHVSTRLRRAVRHASVVIGGHPITTTVSLGIAEANTADDVATLLERAKSEMTKAVALGGDRVAFPVESLIGS